MKEAFSSRMFRLVVAHARGLQSSARVLSRRGGKQSDNDLITAALATDKDEDRREGESISHRNRRRREEQESPEAIVMEALRNIQEDITAHFPDVALREAESATTRRRRHRVGEFATSSQQADGKQR